jgi:hypothetical protein
MTRKATNSSSCLMPTGAAKLAKTCMMRVAVRIIYSFRKTRISPKKRCPFLIPAYESRYYVRGRYKKRCLGLQEAYVQENYSLSNGVHNRSLLVVAIGRAPSERSGMPRTQQDPGRKIWPLKRWMQFVLGLALPSDSEVRGSERGTNMDDDEIHLGIHGLILAGNEKWHTDACQCKYYYFGPENPSFREIHRRTRVCCQRKDISVEVGSKRQDQQDVEVF